jgi:hypothetical protein
MSLNFKINLPSDTTDLEGKVAEFMAKKIINECKPQEVELIIDYLEKSEQMKNT